MYRGRGREPSRATGRGGPRGQRGGRPSYKPPPSRIQAGGPTGSLVTTNLFPIRTLPTKSYWQYEVDIQPEVKNFARRQEIFNKLRSNVAPEIFGSLPIYDGNKQMYVSTELHLLGSNEGSTFLVAMGPNTPAQVGQRGTYQVRLTKTTAVPINFSDLPRLLTARGSSVEAVTVATNLLQLIIKQASNMNHVHNNRSYFVEQGKLKLEGSGLELLHGFFQSIRPGINELYVNVDTSMTAAYQPGPLLGVVMDFMNKGGDVRALKLKSDSADYRKLANFLKNVQVKIQTTGRVKRIRGLVENADAFQFVNRDGIATTVGEYMKALHNRDLMYRGIVGVNLSNPNQPPTIVPMELCDVVPGQLYKKRIPDAFTATAVGFATLSPQDRLAWIAAPGLAPIGDYARSEFIVESGMVIDEQPKNIKGGILAAPSVVFQRPTRVDNGKWRVEKLNNPKSLSAWVVVSFSTMSIGNLKTQMRRLFDCCKALGMGTFSSRLHLYALIKQALGATEPSVVQQGTEQNPERSLRAAINTLSQDAQTQNIMVIVILPSSPGAGDLRAKVKHWGDVTEGIRTQCLREDKVMNAGNPYWNNVALKLNARLGGRNFLVESQVMQNIRRESTIIMGADVGHAGPGIQRPSVASLVWSTDNTVVDYRAMTCIQPPRQEKISNLEAMAEHALLQSFARINGNPPSRIFFFRDGLSEGEYERTAREEIAMIENVWKKRNVTRPPKLTYVVVGKGHHIVFFPGASSDACDDKGNCKAGFVTKEADIPSALAPDFYLMSHPGALGTSRSSHYIVLRDDNQAGIEGIQNLAYSLCHVYARATRSVSIPAPVYYADLACSRLAFHISPDSQIRFGDTGSVASGGQDQVDLEQWAREYGKINSNMENSMYFL
ncbi:hypothetical protein VNI00_005874 [Paramarasmius palmivorus]|uniref:Piwi-domain-containing protein n=1 Tax=Paramarasmius palmivorus TaxID=297713 RepID=A0AAW0DE33_9AGAR